MKTFSDQRLSNWRQKSQLPEIVFMLIGAAFSFAIAIFITIQRQNYFYMEQRYDLKCTKLGQKCKINFELNKDLEAPIFFYIELQSFYQNYQFYINSISYDQLKGKEYDSNDCYPLVTNLQMGKTLSINKKKLEEGDVAIPCGLVAKTFFNDEFELYHELDGLQDMSTNNIAWDTDQGKYKNIDLDKQWINLETNERFIQWTRLASLGIFQKLWGRFDKDLKLGQYTMEITNNFNISLYEGKKIFVISNGTMFSNNGMVLMIAMYVLGGAQILASIYSLINTKKPLKKQYMI